MGDEGKGLMMINGRKGRRKDEIHSGKKGKEGKTEYGRKIYEKKFK